MVATPPFWHSDAVGGRPPHHPLATKSASRSPAEPIAPIRLGCADFVEKVRKLYLSTRTLELISANRRRARTRRKFVSKQGICQKRIAGHALAKHAEADSSDFFNDIRQFLTFRPAQSKCRSRAGSGR
jgi:hypothetical protein